MKHKIDDYKLNAVDYLTEDKSQKEVLFDGLTNIKTIYI